MLEGDGDRGLLVGPLGDVAFDRDGPVGATQLLGQRVELGDRPGRENQPPALPGEQARASPRRSPTRRP